MPTSSRMLRDSPFASGARRHALRFVRNGSFGFASSALRTHSVMAPLRSSARTSLHLRRFLRKAPFAAPSRLLSAKGHARFGYALLDAGVTPIASLPTFCGNTRVHIFRERERSQRCQPFAGTPVYTFFGKGNVRSAVNLLREHPCTHFSGKGTFAALSTFCGNTRVHIFREREHSRRCQPFAGNPVYTLFGKGNAQSAQIL